MLSIATSIDALAVGLSLALIDGSILWSSLIIGVTSLILSVAGFLLGDRLGCRFGKRMEQLGGLILIGIGLKVLLSHLFGL
jgi:putative Mn2+ efflux pump MntP